MTTRQMMDEWGADRLKLAAAEARVRELEAAIYTARGHLGAALMQTAPSDDQIIVGHVRDAEAALKGGAK